MAGQPLDRLPRGDSGMSKAADLAYEQIRNKIITGAYTAGAHLKEEEVAEEAGVSRTPVREALRRLDAEHLVKFVPYRGAYVASWSTADIEEIFILRAMFEGHAAYRAASRITPAAIAELEACADQIDAQLPGQTETQRLNILAANQRYHAIVLEAAHSERLNKALSWLVEIPIILRTFERYTERDLLRSNHHHREMIDAFRTRDERWAQNVMDTHLRAAFRRYVVHGNGST